MPTSVRRNKLQRIYGRRDLHFITFSCFRRMPLLGSPAARDVFEQTLGEAIEHFQCGLAGYVVMPEHVHLLVGEPGIGDISKFIQAVKRRASSKFLKLRRGRPNSAVIAHFWQPRFYDFNVWNEKKKAEKLEYMHANPVKRGLVIDPRDWKWSSYGFYWGRGETRLRIETEWS